MFIFRAIVQLFRPRVLSPYDEYRIKDVSCAMLGIAVFSAAIIQSYYATLTVSSPHYELKYFLKLLRALYILPCIYLWFMIYRHQNGHKNYIFSIPTFSNFCLLACMGTQCIAMTVRTYVGECTSNDNTAICNPDHESNALPQDAITSMSLVFIGYQILFKCFDRWALFGVWLGCLFTVLFNIFFLKTFVSAYMIFLLFVVGFVLYEYERKTLNTFTALQNMEQSVRNTMHAENEKRVMEMRSVEMRHLLGNVAHDLKTPMQSFVMELEFLDKKLKKPIALTAESVTYALQEIREVIESMQNLIDTNSFMYMVINRAIDYAKSSSDHSLCPNLDTINFEDSIKWALNIVKTKSSVPVLLEPVPPEVVRHIITDKQWLIENILCLISNAAKFTTHGSVMVRCNIEEPSVDAVSDQQQMLLIEVEDTGIGIPEDKRESMFQPFQQTMRMAGGTGLGLYSLRNRVQALKGTCGISSRRDGTSGARVWFKIPYRVDCTYQADAETKETDGNGVELSLLLLSSTPRSQSTAVETPLSTERDTIVVSVEESAAVRILLVDDSLTIRKSISRVLCNEGCAVDMAENGQMALEMMGLKRYDLVLMDLQMPVMDGLEAVRRLRQQEKDCGDEYHQKIIGISAYAGEPYASDAVTAGMDGFIEKPFSANRFLALCEEHGIQINK